MTTVVRSSPGDHIMLYNGDVVHKIWHPNPVIGPDRPVEKKTMYQ